MLRWAVVCALCTAAFAQSQRPSGAARVEGRVIGDSDERPLRRARVVLRPVEAGFRGVPPGNYVWIAWLDDPPCDVYDPEALDACRAAGMAVTVSRSGQENVLFTVKQKR